MLVAPGSVDALAQAIGRLALDPALRARLAAAGRNTVMVQYSFARRMEKIANLYDQLLEN